MTKRDERKKSGQGSNLSKSSHFKFTFLPLTNTDQHKCEPVRIPREKKGQN